MLLPISENDYLIELCRTAYTVSVIIYFLKLLTKGHKVFLKKNLKELYDLRQKILVKKF